MDLSPSFKRADPQEALAGERVTFTIVLHNVGASASPGTHVADPIPANTTYVTSSAQVVGGGSLDDSDGIDWTGTVAAGARVTITFQVTLNQSAFISNTAVITDGYGTVKEVTAWVNAKRVYLPLAMRQFP